MGIGASMLQNVVSFCAGEGFGLNRPWQFGLSQALVQIFAYFGPNLLLCIGARNGWLKQWKIQKAHPPLDLVKEAVKKNALDFYMIILIGRYFFYKLLTLGKKTLNAGGGKFTAVTDTSSAEDPSLPKQNHEDAVVVTKSDEEPKHEKLGWSNLRFTGPPAPLLKIVGTVLIAYLGYDFMFYWSHRMLHIHDIYHSVHKKHHKFIQTVGPTASYSHIVEDIIQMFNWYVPIGVAGYLFGDLHIYTLTAYNAFRWLETVDAHSGYNLPFSIFTLLPIFAGARGHDFHHSHWVGNFGATPFWDWLCGTDSLYRKLVLNKLTNAKN